MEIANEKIGNKIRIARAIKGWSQDGLAKALGKSQTWVQQAEKGEIDFTITHLNDLSKELEINPEFLLFTTPQQVFNNYNCKIRTNGTFQNCVINSEEFLNKIAEILSNPKQEQ